MPELLEAIQLKNYYAVAALVLTLLIQLCKKAPKLRDAWAKIPDGWRWLIPILGGAVTGFVDAFNAGLPLGAAALATLGGALGIGLGAMGLNAALTESHVPWNGGPGGLPKDTRYRDTVPPPPGPPSFPPLAAAMLGLLLLSCGGSQPDPLTPLVCQSLLAQQRIEPNKAARICSDGRIAAQLTADIAQAVQRAALAATPAFDVGGGSSPGGGSISGGSGGAQ